MLIHVTIACCLAQMLVDTLAAPAADEITGLPGWSGPLPSKQYSGFLDVSAQHHLHYVFVEASGTDPAKAPVVLCAPLCAPSSLCQHLLSQRSHAGWRRGSDSALACISQAPAHRPLPLPVWRAPSSQGSTAALERARSAMGTSRSSAPSTSPPITSAPTPPHGRSSKRTRRPGPPCVHPSHASEISGTLSLVNTAVNFALPSSLHLVGQVANVIFLESPSNVGFSYCGAKPTGEHEGQQTAPCSWTDTSTAKLNYDALQAFYAKFPEYQTNPFYIWGESYAGPPSLRLVEQNARKESRAGGMCQDRLGTHLSKIENAWFVLFCFVLHRNLHPHACRCHPQR